MSLYSTTSLMVIEKQIKEAENRGKKAELTQVLHEK